MPANADAALEAGDIVWIDFGDPVGHEQGGRRPALVVTPRDYNENSSVMVVCPISRRAREWPFNVPLPPSGFVSGFILLDQIKAIDPAARAFKRAGRLPDDILMDVRRRLAILLGIPTS